MMAKSCPLEKEEEEVLAKIGNIDLKWKHLRLLRPRTWINDDIVDCYFTLLQERADRFAASWEWRRSFLVGNQGLPDVLADMVGDYLNSPGLACRFMSSFLITKMLNSGYQEVKRWSTLSGGKIVGDRLDMVFFPVFMGLHWRLGVINFRDKRFEYYNSLRICAAERGFMKRVLKKLRTYVEGEADGNVNLEGWRDKVMSSDDIPQQDNAYDCGVFMCKYAELLSEKRPLEFSALDIPRVRYHMMRSLATGRIEAYY